MSCAWPIASSCLASWNIVDRPPRACHPFTGVERLHKRLHKRLHTRSAKRAKNGQQQASEARLAGRPTQRQKMQKPRIVRGFWVWHLNRASGQGRDRTGDTCIFSARDQRQKRVICREFEAVAEPLHQRLHLAGDLLHFAGLLRDALDADQRRRLAVELLRE